MDILKFNQFVRDIYHTDQFIPLHEPRFLGNEKKYVLETIDSTFVSSVGAFVTDFEEKVQVFTGCERAVATVNGTAALPFLFFVFYYFFLLVLSVPCSMATTL